MGNANWSQSDWATYSARTSTKSRQQIFAQSSLHPDLDPAKIKVRECVDSPANPNSTPIIVSCDVTGSMGRLAEIIVRGGLNKIMSSIIDHKPVSDPEVMLMATGDAYGDRAPLQATQFEAGVDPMVKQIEQIWLEGNGQGNGGESYSLAWFFATYKTVCDAIIKRGRKGYIFTIGDECCHKFIKKEQVPKYLGLGCEVDIPTKELLADTQRFWHVFHLIVQPVATQPVVKSWKELLGENAIMVEDEKELPEVITTIIRLIEGQHEAAQGTSLVVRNATAHLVPA